MLAVALLLGLAVGVVLGALGGGGSILTVPVLVFLLGLTPSEATSGSLVVVGITSVVAAVSHARSGNTRWTTGGALAAAGVPASYAGSALHDTVDPDVLLLAFAAVMLVAAAGMLARAGPDDGETGPAMPLPGWHALVPRVVVGGSVIGFLTGFLGVGGGFLIVPVLVLGLGLAMPVAVGTSLLVIAVNSAVALAARADGGAFEWSVVAPFTVAAVLGSLGGKRIAVRLPAHRLSRWFAGLLVVVAVYVGARAVLGTG